MKRAHLSIAVGGVVVLGVVVGASALFLGTDRAAEKQRAVGASAPRPHPRPPAAKLKPGSVAPAAVKAEQRPAHDEHGPAPSLAGGDEHDGHGHEGHGGPGVENVEEQERLYAANLERARAVIEKGSAAVLAALRGQDRDLAKALFDALLDDPVAHCERELLDGLLAWALDATATGVDREVAFDLLGRSPGTGEALLAKVAEASVNDPDPDARLAALTAVRQLAMEREDLADASRAALTTAAEKTASAEHRGDALSSIRAEHASAEELARISRFLADPDATVRVAAAIALTGTEAEHRAPVSAAIEQAFVRESDPDSAGALASTALRVSRGDAAALLDRLARSDIARSNAGVARQLQDYRSLLADGETDPVRIERIHQEREDARSVAESR